MMYLIIPSINALYDVINVDMVSYRYNSLQSLEGVLKCVICNSMIQLIGISLNYAMNELNE